MLLGTCNFGREYNQVKVEKKECFKMLEYFETHGGHIIDTAENYDVAQDIIAESGYTGKIITKAWKVEDVEKSLNRLKVSKIYAILARDSRNELLIDYLKDLKKKGIIEKYGISIYYPHELRQDVNIVQFTASTLFDNYLPTMSLMADVYVRSIFKRQYEYYAMKNKEEVKDYVIGCDNLEQLKQNMGAFK